MSTGASGLQGPIGDEFRRFDVILQPELWDRSCIGGIRWKIFVEWIVLERMFLPCLDLLWRWLCSSRDDRETAFIAKCGLFSLVLFRQ